MKYVFPEEKLFLRPVDLRKRYGEGYDPNLFKRWTNEGLIEKMRNGLYRNTGYPFKGELDRFVTAGQLYGPSYISTYSALRHYNLIPEVVYGTTSLTTRKTKTFDTSRGRFQFQKVKRQMFFGFDYYEWNGGLYRIARPEKCLLDLAYLDPNFSDPEWLEEMRFDREELMMQIDIPKMAFYSKVMQSSVLFDRIDLLYKVYEL